MYVTANMFIFYHNGPVRFLMSILFDSLVVQDY